MNAVFDALFKESEERKRRKEEVAAHFELTPRASMVVTQAQSAVSPVCLSECLVKWSGTRLHAQIHTKHIYHV